MKIKAKNIWVEYEIFGFTTFFLSVYKFLYNIIKVKKGFSL